MSKEKKKNTLVHDALILFAITVIAAVALGFVYEITKEPIATAKEQAKIEAYKTVFPEMVSTAEETAGDISAYQKLIDNEPALEGTTVDEVLRAIDADGKTAGWVMTISNSKGYGGKITLTVGIEASGDGSSVTVKGIEFITISETAGLGMRAKEDGFKSQFDDRFDISSKGYSLTKKKIPGDVEVDAISNATITSTAVTRSVNAAILVGEYLTGLGIN